MTAQIIENKKIWEDFVAKLQDKTFLQSWSWGEFEQSMGNKIWRLGVVEEDQIFAVALVAKIQAKRGTFLLIRHGPLVAKPFSPNKEEMLKVLVEEIKHIAKEEGASFLRMNPLWMRDETNEGLLKRLGFRAASMHANAYEATLQLDITLSADELLKNMRKTTRYVIKQAAKNPEIRIEKSDQLADIAMLNELNKEVAGRQKFMPFADAFTKNEFEIFLKDGYALLFFGKYQEKLACAALVIFWSGIAFYHQAASRAEFAKFSIPYLLQWEAICEAKRRGCAIYDFWGYVDTEKYPHHPWAGPTKFKMGFGGKAYEYVKTRDLPLTWRYWPVALFEVLRKYKRHL